MNRNKAISYMLTIAEEHFDGIDVDMTALAEACAAHFNEDDGDGPLDDIDHPIWEWAMTAAETFKETNLPCDHEWADVGDCETGPWVQCIKCDINIEDA